MAEAEGGPSPAKRRLPVDLDELAEALHWHSGEMDWYLDLETGDVVVVGREERSICEQAQASLGESGGDLAAELARMGVPDWQRETALLIDAIESDSVGRFLAVDAVEPWQEYRDMEDFIGSVSDEGLQEDLADAIRGRGAFRRFKDRLLEHPHWRDAWHAFSHARKPERVLEWLESEDIEALPRGGPGGVAGG